MSVLASPVAARSPLADSLDTRINSDTTIAFGETSVFVNPLKPDVLLVASGSQHVAFVSTNGGTGWTPDATTVGTDPAVAISADTTFGDYGRFVMLGFTFGLGTDYKDTPAATGWTTSEVTASLIDKGHLWVDNSPSSARQYDFVAAWTNSEELNRIDIARSEDAEIWVDHTFISHNDTKTNWGVNIQTGRNGHVYLAWSKMSGLEGRAGAFGFSEANNTQFSFSSERLLLNGNVVDVGLADRTTTPSMAVDRSTAAGDSLYMVWAQKSGSYSDILLMKGYRDFDSTAVNWDENNLVRVNAGTEALRYWPWIAWDECSGMLAVVFMEASGSSAVTTKVAVSADHGTSWTEVIVSDVGWSGNSPSAGYDYIGIAAADGRAFPVWADDRLDPNSQNLDIYVSPLLLWGVDQDSVAVCYDDDADSLTVIARRTTNIGADAGDAIALTSPSQETYSSSLCTECAEAGGKTHTVSFKVPRESGVWQYTVSSRRTGCLQLRSSDLAAFTVPDVALTASGSAGPTCPAGDGTPYLVGMDFAGLCADSVTSSRVRLEALPVNTSIFATAFFPQNTRQPADSAATTANSFSTTITERQIGGCTGDSVEVYLDDVGIGKVWFPATPSVDLNGSGYVDAGDLARLGGILDSCADSTNYDPCGDFVPDANHCIGDDEIDVLADHLGHNWTQPLSKSGGSGTLVTHLALEPELPSGHARVSVSLAGLTGRSAVGVVLRPAAGIQFSGWTVLSEHARRAFLVAGMDASGPRLALLVLDVMPDATGEVALGTMDFSASSMVLTDLTITYEDVASVSTSLEAAPLQGRLVQQLATRLAQNRPNPFNPQTTIEYALPRDDKVAVVIVDVAGRHVRTLVQGLNRAGTHSVIWDGRDDTGRHVASGIYLYRLLTSDAAVTRRLVVIR